MSADRYSECPKCKESRTAMLAAEAETLAKAYGKVPHAEWSDMQAEYVKRAKQRVDLFTFRENWEIFNDGEKVTVDYGGGCDVCGLELDFKYSNQLYNKHDPQQNYSPGAEVVG